MSDAVHDETFRGEEPFEEAEGKASRLERLLLTMTIVVGASLMVLAGVLIEKSWLGLPSWLSGTITAETTPSATRSQPTAGSPPHAVARQQAESAASQQRTDTLQALMSGLQQQADALQKEMAERQQQLHRMSGLQQQELQEISSLQQQVLQQISGLQQQVLMEVAERKQQTSDLHQQADALQKEVAEQTREVQQMVRRPHQPSIRRVAGNHQPNGVHRHGGRSKQSATTPAGTTPPPDLGPGG